MEVKGERKNSRLRTIERSGGKEQETELLYRVKKGGLGFGNKKGEGGGGGENTTRHSVKVDIRTFKKV